MSVDPREYYSRPEVASEAAEYLRGRWVALEGPPRGKGRAFFRYSGGAPLRVDSPEDLGRLVARFSFARVRSIYGTANVYRRLESRGDPDDPSNVAASTPVWDVDNEPERWGQTLEAARVLVDELERAGVTKSVYLIWSGRGCHVRVSERAFSPELLSEVNPLDASYAVVALVLRRASERIAEVARSVPASAGRALAVENEMDAKRVFTAPLSLHRELDRAAVCFGPDEIDSFDPTWADPHDPVHSPRWRSFERGEADHLAREALAEVGGYWGRTGGVRARVGSGAGAAREAGSGVGRGAAPARRPAGRGRVGRFQVMALLQAARFFVLRGDLERAKSFGLNRAIFYAWAKRRGVRARAGAGRAAVTGRAAVRGAGGRQAALPLAEGGRGAEGEGRERTPRAESLGDEVAYVGEGGLFTIGGDVQRPEDFDRQVARRIESLIPFDRAWEAAVSYVSRFPREVLESQRAFYEMVYKPVRDSFLRELVGRG